ncbi:MAG: glycosyltransferase family 4 protein [Pseudomonadota bacterium]
MRKIDIAHVNLARGFRGGERQTELLALELARHGFRQRIVGRKGEPLIERLAGQQGIETVGVSGILMAAAALRDVRLAHAHEGRCVQATALAGWRFRVPYVITRRVVRPLKNNPVTRYVYRNAAARVGISSAIANDLNAYTNTQTSPVIPSAFTPSEADPDRVRQLRAAWGAGPIIGHIGALIGYQKGQPDLIEIAKRHPEWQVVLVGSGEDEDNLKRQAAALSNVHFTGQVTDVASHMAAFDIFAFPSRFEGLGSIILDAMHLGIPVIGANVGGIPDLIEHEQTGLLIERESIDQLEQSVARLLSDSALRQDCIDEARRRIDRYSPQAMGARYLSLYATLGVNPRNTDDR